MGDDADGDLYKCGYVTQPANLTNTGSIGIEDEDSGRFYSYDLKNNKKTSTHAALKNLISRLNSPTLTKEEFARLVDLDQFISFAAVSYFLGNPDDIRNNWALDKVFESSMDSAKRTKLLKGWHKAVKCAMVWGDED